MNQLSIALIAPPWYEIPPTTYGGIEAVVGDLTDRLVAGEHQVWLVATGRDRTSAHFVQTYERPPASDNGTLPDLVQAASTARALERLAADGQRIDVIHDHSLAGPLLARGRDIPTIVTMHWPVVGDLARYFRLIGDTIGLVAISDAQRRLTPELPWIGTVHNGIDVARFPYRDTKEDFVVFLGRYGPEKSPHLAIDAAREAGLLIQLAGKCADPPELAYFAEHISPRNGPGVRHVGELGFEAKTALLSRARCLVFPIRWEEPFGLVMVEAMACGTPVVALRGGAVAEVIVDGVTGFVCDDPSELGPAILEAKKLEPADCRRHVERHFDLDTMVRGYETLYRTYA